MNIHLPPILGFTRYQSFDPSPYAKKNVVGICFRRLAMWSMMAQWWPNDGLILAVTEDSRCGVPGAFWPCGQPSRGHHSTTGGTGKSLVEKSDPGLITLSWVIQHGWKIPHTIPKRQTKKKATLRHVCLSRVVGQYVWERPHFCLGHHHHLTTIQLRALRLGMRVPAVRQLRWHWEPGGLKRTVGTYT